MTNAELAAHLRRRALEYLRQAAALDGIPHIDDHVIEFRDDGWTIRHPLTERIVHPDAVFDCPHSNWTHGDPGVRGRWVLTHTNGVDELGEQIQ